MSEIVAIGTIVETEIQFLPAELQALEAVAKLTSDVMAAIFQRAQVTLPARFCPVARRHSQRFKF